MNYSELFNPENVSERQTYLLHRIAGLPVPPLFDLNRGEEPYDLITDWILDENCQISDILRGDLHEQLRRHLRKAIRGDIAELVISQLGGLLVLAINLADETCGELITDFLTGGRGGKPVRAFSRIEREQCFYGEIGRLAYSLINACNPENAIDIFVTGIEFVTSADIKSTILSYVLRRDSELGERLGESVIKYCMLARDNKAMHYGIRLLREICWEKDDMKTAENIRDWCINGSEGDREFADSVMTSALSSKRIKAFSTELKHGRISQNPRLQNFGFWRYSIAV